MTTKRQILSLYRPLLERHSDLALIQAKFGPLVVLKPIHHLVRGFRVQRTAYSDYPEYHWDVGFTFWHKASVYGVAGTNFVTPDIKTMYWSHPHHEAAFIDSIETEILPILRSVGTIQALLSFSHPMEPRWRWRLELPVNQMCLQAALGDFAAVARASAEMRAKGPLQLPWWGEQTYGDMMEGLLPFCEAGDRAGVAALLHHWEDNFIATHGLQALHEKTPFPVEHRSE